jgi:hypothetical protein
VAAAAPSSARRSGWQRWLWFKKLDRYWLLNHPLLWRSRVLWIPALALAMGLAFVAVAVWQPLQPHDLPGGVIPTTAGLAMFAGIWIAYLVWTLVPRSQHPLGVRRWRDHLVTFAVSYAAALLMVVPVVLYDGIFSQRVAALGPAANVKDARAILLVLESMKCVDHASPLAQTLAVDLRQLLRPFGVTEVTMDRCGLVSPEMALTLRYAGGGAGNQRSWITSLQRIEREQAEGQGAHSHAANAALRSLLRRQVGCVLMALLPVLLDLWVQRVRSRGLRLPGLPRWTRAPLWLGARQTFGLRHALLVTRPALWAGHGGSFVVVCTLLAAGGFAWLMSVGNKADKTAVLPLASLLGLLFTGLGLWYWKRVARLWPLPAQPGNGWRAYLSHVAVAFAATFAIALALPALLLTGGAVWSGKDTLAFVALALFAGAHVVATAALMQATRSPLLLRGLSLAYVLGALVLWTDAGALMLLVLWAIAAAASWWARRNGGFAGRPWARWAAVVQIALSPLVAASVVVLVVLAGLGSAIEFGTLVLLVMLVPLAWLIKPAIEGLLQVRDEPSN